MSQESSEANNVDASKQTPESSQEEINDYLKHLGLDSPTARDKLDRTALHHAAANGHVDLIAALKNRRLYLEARDQDGSTPLLWAAYYGRLEAIECLIKECGVDPNACDNEDRTALHWAARRGHHKAVERLINWGLDPNALTAAGKSVLGMADLSENQDCIAFCTKENLARFRQVYIQKQLRLTAGVTDDMSSFPGTLLDLISEYAAPRLDKVDEMRAATRSLSPTRRFSPSSFPDEMRKRVKAETRLPPDILDPLLRFLNSAPSRSDEAMATRFLRELLQTNTSLFQLQQKINSYLQHYQEELEEKEVEGKPSEKKEAFIRVLGEVLTYRASMLAAMFDRREYAKFYVMFHERGDDSSLQLPLTIGGVTLGQHIGRDLSAFLAYLDEKVETQCKQQNSSARRERITDAYLNEVDRFIGASSLTVAEKNALYTECAQGKTATYRSLYEKAAGLLSASHETRLQRQLLTRVRGGVAAELESTARFFKHPASVTAKAAAAVEMDDLHKPAPPP